MDGAPGEKGVPGEKGEKGETVSSSRLRSVKCLKEVWHRTINGGRLWADPVHAYVQGAPGQDGANGVDGAPGSRGRKGRRERR